MEEFFSVPKLLEIGFNTLSAATALFVVATALRVASSFTLTAHRRAMQVLAAASVVVVAS
jgi:intracellular septation protein A